MRPAPDALVEAAELQLEAGTAVVRSKAGAGKVSSLTWRLPTTGPAGSAATLGTCNGTAQVERDRAWHLVNDSGLLRDAVDCVDT
ncbi:hypothetical protein PHYPSEUDO_012313 [Phytophthora pseudosyringae]|uniref:Uncharacterized protein n=1 Tax=Phytophthora pseudosyringae TaxID=221518 RepID=A0A8T1W4M1_9STRA|nr:hypothetical protein PHYPSEUDO_012313 [Phytophthora pseudosyringae]